MIMLTLSSERIFNQMHYTGTKFVSMYFLQTQIQAVPVLSSLYPFRISFSSLTFTCAPYRIFLLFLPCLPCHFYLAVIEQQQQHILQCTPRPTVTPQWPQQQYIELRVLLSLSYQPYSEPSSAFATHCKANSDSSPRNSRLSASWELNSRSPETPRIITEHYRIERFKRGP